MKLWRDKGASTDVFSLHVVFRKSISDFFFAGCTLQKQVWVVHAKNNVATATAHAPNANPVLHFACTILSYIIFWKLHSYAKSFSAPSKRIRNAREVG